MSCGCNIEQRLRYPETVIALWFSSVEQNNPQTDAHITNASDGYMQQMEEIGQSSLAPGTHVLTNLGNDPYSTRLRCVSNLSRIYNAVSVFLEKIEFFGYDTTLEGSLFQDAATITAIHNSRATNDAYAQSLYKNAMIMNWQPNWFRPEFRIGSDNILSGLDGSQYSSKNLGDCSIGLPCPICFSQEKEFSKVKNIEVYAQLVQKVGGIYQRYPVLCMATFWISNLNLSKS